MEKELFEFIDYRSYILHWFAFQPKRGRGLRAALAHALKCPPSHISQVLKGHSNLTLEQAEELNDFFGHTHESAEFFSLLVLLARAGSLKLKMRISAQLEKAKQVRLNLSKRLDVKSAISKEDQTLFYSSWHYATIHVLLTIDGFQTNEPIAKHLGLSLKKVNEALALIVRLGLAAETLGRYSVGTARVHLGADSPMISKHHINWRIQAIRSLEVEADDYDLHYSSVITISRADVARIKSLLVKAIENSKAIIQNSKEEELHSLCLDFFPLKGKKS